MRSQQENGEIIHIKIEAVEKDFVVYLIINEITACYKMVNNLPLNVTVSMV